SQRKTIQRAAVEQNINMTSIQRNLLYELKLYPAEIFHTDVLFRSHSPSGLSSTLNKCLKDSFSILLTPST
ncbi:hypothetical protein SK128_018303, partial [Halocaridina rubra]